MSVSSGVVERGLERQDSVPICFSCGLSERCDRDAIFQNQRDVDRRNNPHKVLYVDRGCPPRGNEDLLPGIKVNTDAMSRMSQLVQEGFVQNTEWD
jgi:hypothetical protein